MATHNIETPKKMVSVKGIAEYLMKTKESSDIRQT